MSILIPTAGLFLRGQGQGSSIIFTGLKDQAIVHGHAQVAAN